jgi:hypothetical protein
MVKQNRDADIERSILKVPDHTKLSGAPAVEPAGLDLVTSAAPVTSVKTLV